MTSLSPVKLSTKRKVARRIARVAHINGQHPLRTSVPNGFVDYAARIRRGGRVFYFNFGLAVEMGLIPGDYPHVIDAALEQMLLETFSLVIINEYDLLHGLKVDLRDVKANKYMATRYLQLQHPSRKGHTSGDGRSIWNGVHQGRNGTWDVSSCGTGATRLSPACAQQNKFFQTGDDKVSYGCGLAEVEDGISAAVMSEIFYHSGISTERTLAIIEFDDGTSINVRAGKNLLRPAHFFHHVKQNDFVGLQQAVDYYIERQVSNGEWPRKANRRARYQHFLQRIATDFARASALFESEYIFCWMDWDGDNILTDGGVIDYGSVRQFGLFHHEYRYDDVERMSTTITEQKTKAKYIVQTFAQIVDYLLTGRKKNIKHFVKDPVLTVFDRVFLAAKDERILYKLGLPPEVAHELMKKRRNVALVQKFRSLCSYFEEAKTQRGPYEVSDGINWDAIFCLRDMLRELPQHWLATKRDYKPEEFVAVMRSTYAQDADVKITRGRREKISEFQATYQELVRRAADQAGCTPRRLLRQIAKRAAIINRYERVTGDALIWIAKKLARGAKTISSGERHRLIEDFVIAQVTNPEFQQKIARLRRRRNGAHPELYESMLKIVREHREGI